ncbi:hypothetical protein V2J09_017486 [Rumex salicifolius]
MLVNALVPNVFVVANSLFASSFTDGENQIASKEDNLEGHWAYEHAKFKAKIELLERNHRNTAVQCHCKKKAIVNGSHT